MLHNKLHTAGHLIDYLLSQAEYKFESKVYYFPSGTYVEHKVILNKKSRQKLLPFVEQIVNNIVKTILKCQFFIKIKINLKILIYLKLLKKT